VKASEDLVGGESVNQRIPLAGGYVSTDGQAFPVDSDTPIKLSTSCQAILAELVKANGAVVDNSRLLASIVATSKDWTSSEDDYLRKQIQILRERLGFLTVVNSRHGYRLGIAHAEALTVEELTALESPEYEGGQLRSGAVVYLHATQPSEAQSHNVGLAHRVIQNMRRDITYYYFMGPDSRHVAELAAALVYADRHFSGTEARPELDYFRSRLRIFQVHDFLPFDFCVHNADDVDGRVCYVRRSDYPRLFLYWGRGASVAPLVEAQAKTIPSDYGHKDDIIQSTAGAPQRDLHMELGPLIRSQLKMRGLQQKDIEEVVALFFPNRTTVGA
jgi:hypothetical protein